MLEGSFAGERPDEIECAVADGSHVDGVVALAVAAQVFG
jgi:hypothetical protein